MMLLHMGVRVALASPRRTELRPLPGGCFLPADAAVVVMELYHAGLAEPGVQIIFQDEQGQREVLQHDGLGCFLGFTEEVKEEYACAT